jgi:hypothetical protein
MGTLENISILSESPFWIMDGAFHVAPAEFEQLCVIQSKEFNINVPLVYVLMEYRSKPDYDRLFYIQRKLQILLYLIIF